MKMNKKLTFIPLLALLFAACTKKADFDYDYYTADEVQLLGQYLNLPDGPVDYTIHFPAHLAILPLAVDNSKALLGRVLFYDKNLSVDGTIACASCHKQELAFADNVAFSKGVNGHVTARNSLALGAVTNFTTDYESGFDATGSLRFFWDNRANTAAEQCRGSLTNSREMGMTMQGVTQKVNSLPYYKPLIHKAYYSEVLGEDEVLDAIASFVNAMGSIDSKFDREANSSSPAGFVNTIIYNDPFLGFSAAENRGKAIYNQFCATCHSGDFRRPVLGFANNGLDENTASDEGVGGISGATNQMGCFKVPALRNIALTAPYMHDGRFKTLEEVVGHYSTGIKMHPNLSNSLRDPDHNDQPLRMNFSTQDKSDLIAFLNTLTDYKLLSEEQFSDPFIH